MTSSVDPLAVDHLPYGSLLDADGLRFAAVRWGEAAFDLTRWSRQTPFAELFGDGSLDGLLAAGHRTWDELRAAVVAALGVPATLAAFCRPLAWTTPTLPFAPGDYVDFYASRDHATNVGRILRPDGEPLTPNWRHLPIGYHGRAGTIVVSGTEIRRPWGQFRTADGDIEFAASDRLDLEAEVAFVLGGSTTLGESIPLVDARDYIFGVCLLNDWSARDIQSWEYVPLGPFLGKSFATSMSPWITPLSALEDAWLAPPARDTQLLAYLDDAGRRDALDLALEVRINGQLMSRPPFPGMYWTPAQMLAHLTVNGASIRPGDLFASGTVSGPTPDQVGSLLELTWNGTRPKPLGDGRMLRFLEDGDEVAISATAPGRHGRITLGECRGRVVEAVQR
ncbi:fumarylacetoacetate hydrolase [Jatrophihabitans sp. GAS493]|uniref:fumarylacetoacetate hydrolase family protein n=1 Tax=Jatrophihabitans sp. GAS493 TaxID=1907575 RepID=UPI000BB86B80|nr:fumarylacetoacetate hydrolase family protein [Jatrophihabitans sp. GAS493]SOD72818.1 fumarylacetoacetate hydrolase [Jatrophihabitans sp. GAS493]